MRHFFRRPLLLSAATLFATIVAVGCGGGQVTPPASLSSTASHFGKPKQHKQLWKTPVHPGSFFAAALPPFSPNTAHTSHLTRGGHPRPKPTELGAGSDFWFYFVNGTEIPHPSSRPSGVPSALPSGIVPGPLPTNFAVLTVATPIPQGAPWPNGGTPVEMASLIEGNSTESQLWKVVPVSSGSSEFYLRSGVSFSGATGPVASNGDYTANLLTGNGTTGDADFDLGVLSNVTPNAALYMNATVSPMNLSATFQSWSYNYKTAQITNGNGGVLSRSGSNLVLVQAGSGTPPPATQWYAVPNYYAYSVITQPNSTPRPFPAFYRQQAAAYDYVSQTVMGSYAAYPCKLEGKTYSGIRCQYVNLDASVDLAQCATLTELWLADKTPPPHSSISLSNWTSVLTQLHQECAYAAQVQGLWATYETVFNYIFESSSSQIPEIAFQVGQGVQKKQVTGVAADIVVGVVNAILKISHVPGSTAIASLLSTGLAIDHAENNKKNAANDPYTPIRGAAAGLYAQMGTQFLVMDNVMNNAELRVLSDWGRLSKIGPLTEIQGPNGLALEPGSLASIETAGVNGYSVYFLQQLMPVVYALNQYPAGEDNNSGEITCASCFAKFLIFGNKNGSPVNTASYTTSGTTSPAPSPVVADLQTFNANTFDAVYGVNGWSQMARWPQTLPSVDNTSPCNLAIVTVFNNTTIPVWVTPSASSGSLAQPFTVLGSAPSGVSSLPLAPFGYVPIYAATGAGSNKPVVNVSVSTSSGGPVVESFSFQYEGCSTSSSEQMEGTNVKQYQNGSSFYFWPPTNNGNWPVGTVNVFNAGSSGYPNAMYAIVDN